MKQLIITGVIITTNITQTDGGLESTASTVLVTFSTSLMAHQYSSIPEFATWNKSVSVQCCSYREPYSIMWAQSLTPAKAALALALRPGALSIHAHSWQNHYHSTKSKLPPTGNFQKDILLSSTVIHCAVCTHICKQHKDVKVFKHKQSNILCFFIISTLLNV